MIMIENVARLVKHSFKSLQKILQLGLQKVASSNRSLHQSAAPCKESKDYTIADRLLIEEFLVNWKKED